MKRFSLLELFYPRRGACCGRILDKTVEGETCPACAAALPLTRGGWRTKGEFFNFCASPLYYEGPAKEAIHRLKFRGRSAAAKPLGLLLADCIREHCGDWDLICCVPLSLRRERERGYCQAGLIAAAAAEALGREFLPVLKKTRHTPANSGLGGTAARKANVSGAYAVTRPEAVSGRTVLLIDDVITTGATLSECARVLRMAGANHVICATVCKTRKTGNRSQGPGNGAQNAKHG